ncbi:MAG TPA: sugar transferase [Hyphomicrobium sp.]
MFDIVVSATGLLVLSPLLAIVLFLVWRQDGHSPFYIGQRVARGGSIFRMLKIRSMVINADRTGVQSTSADDKRITPLGHFIRRYKLDEFSQLWNVLKGDMSLVGPRPNTLNGVAVYSCEEKRLLTVRPGITDLASIVFSDEGEILKDRPNPDAAYDTLIRPWKSRLGLLYIDHRSFMIDIVLIWATIVGIASRSRALEIVNSIIVRQGAAVELVDVCKRKRPLRSETT